MPAHPFQVRYLGYWLLVLMLLLAGTLNLLTPLLTVLFSLFILNSLSFVKNKWVAVILFVVLVSGILYLFAYFFKQAVDALPEIAADSIPKIIAYAQSQGIELPFEDVHTLKEASIDLIRHQLGYIGNFAKIATKEFAFLVIGFVVAISLFINPQLDLDRGKHPLKNNLYAIGCEEVLLRFRSFYASFSRVMGAQIIISTLNTGFTAIYLVAIDLPYAALVIALTFLCGLLPIIGNLISNSVIVALSFRISPQLAIASLTYLVVLHKLEYFLNSKIIGDRIKNPVWLTLLGLILGERLMGIPGMILAPVILNYIKVEASTIEVPHSPAENPSLDEPPGEGAPMAVPSSDHPKNFA